VTVTRLQFIRQSGSRWVALPTAAMLVTEHVVLQSFVVNRCLSFSTFRSGLLAVALAAVLARAATLPVSSQPVLQNACCDTLL
jgi:hypothetical protein